MNWGSLLRRARLRTLAEGQVQTVRAEATENDARDDVERFQDYGFAANPVDGEGLVLNVCGHTIVIRMDRLAERPELAAHEVCVWHKEGHTVTLKAGRLVQVDCDDLVVNASSSVHIVTPTMTVDASGEVTMNTPELHASTLITAPAIEAATSLKAAGDEVVAHDHGAVSRGFVRTDPLGS